MKTYANAHYAIAIDTPHGLQLIKGLPLMTLPEAQHWQSVAAMAKRDVLVVNTKAE